ncbi:MAG: hypothetical protein KY446_11225 [Proteobacteria bacterium]|nr:hypothetical protein [Pseudomonadota bacterium]
MPPELGTANGRDITESAPFSFGCHTRNVAFPAGTPRRVTSPAESATGMGLNRG